MSLGSSLLNILKLILALPVIGKVWLKIFNLKIKGFFFDSVFSFQLGLLLISLILSFSGLLGINLSYEESLILVLAFSLFSFLALKFKKMFKRPYLNPSLKEILFPLTVFSAISLALIINYYPFITTNLLPGWDPPYYLYYSKQIIKSQVLFWQHISKSSIFIIFSVFSLLSGLDLILSIKIVVLILAVALLLIYFVVCEKIFNRKVGLISLLIVSFTNGFYKLGDNFYANILGLVLILFSILLMLSIEEKSSLAKRILLGIVTGSLFYTHNLSAFSFIIIICIWAIFQLLKKNGRPEGLKSLVSIFLPCLFASSFYLFNFFLPKANNPNQGGTGLETFSRVSSGLILNQPYYFRNLLGDLWYFRFFIGWPITVFGLIGLISILFNQGVALKRKLIFSLWFLVYLLLSQQKIFGFGLVPERYFHFLIFPISASTAWLITRILRNFKGFPKIILSSLAISMIILPPLAKMTNSINKKTSFLVIDQQEIEFINKTVSILKDYPNSVITFSDRHRYWFMNLAEDVNFLYGPKSLICGYGEYENLYNELDINTAQFLSFSNQKIRQQLEERKTLLNKYKNEFVLIKEGETETYKDINKKCVDDDKFAENPQFFEEIYSEADLKLYRVRYNTL